MVMIPCYDANGEPMPDADVDAAEWQTITETLDSNYPPERLNPWCHGDFMVNGEMTSIYVRREGELYTELRVMGPA
jgi:hypothetical protein